MKAWLLDDLTGTESLHVVEAADPTPAANEVVLELDFAALNPADRYLAQNQYPAKPPLPHVLGRDGVGTVTALGAGVEGLAIGDRRLILRGETGVSRWGTFAQRVVVSVDSLATIPSGWSLEQSASASLVYLTAHQALTQWGDLSPAVVLVTGASGGVGVASLQLARALGHATIALSRNAQKYLSLRSLGAAHVFDPTSPDWVSALKLAIAPRRVDLAIDNIGGPLFPRVIDTLGDRGRVSVVGRLAGPVPDFNTGSLFFRRLRIGGVAVGAYSPVEAQSAWKQVVDLLHRADAKPLIDRVFEFDQLPEAFARLAAGPLGKVLIKIRE